MNERVFVGTGIGGCALVVGEFVDCAPTAAAAAAHASAKIFDESISLFSSNVVKLLAIVMFFQKRKKNFIFFWRGEAGWIYGWVDEWLREKKLFERKMTVVVVVVQFSVQERRLLFTSTTVRILSDMKKKITLVIKVTISYFIVDDERWTILFKTKILKLFLIAKFTTTTNNAMIRMMAMFVVNVRKMSNIYYYCEIGKQTNQYGW